MSLDTPRTDKEYQARWDAESLIQAEEVKSNPKRLQAAKQAAKVIEKERAEALAAAQKVSTGTRPRRRRNNTPSASLQKAGVSAAEGLIKQVYKNRGTI